MSVKHYHTSAGVDAGQIASVKVGLDVATIELVDGEVVHVSHDVIDKSQPNPGDYLLSDPIRGYSWMAKDRFESLYKEAKAPARPAKADTKLKATA